MYKALGKAGVKEAEKGAKATALKAALSDDCKSVEAASVSMETRSTKHMEFFVNYNIDPVEGSPISVKQWRFAASEFNDKHGKWLTAETATGSEAPGESDTDKRLKYFADLEKTAPGGIVECEAQLKRRLKHPASANFHSIMGASNFINSSDERAVQIDFEAKNGLGNELTYRGQCVFHQDGTVSVDMFDR